MREFHTYCDEYPDIIEGVDKSQDFIVEELSKISEDVKGLESSEEIVSQIKGLSLMLDDLFCVMNER